MGTFAYCIALQKNSRDYSKALNNYLLCLSYLSRCLSAWKDNDVWLLYRNTSAAQQYLGRQSVYFKIVFGTLTILYLVTKVRRLEPSVSESQNQELNFTSSKSISNS